jgi:hypothetical protein
MKKNELRYIGVEPTLEGFLDAMAKQKGRTLLKMENSPPVSEPPLLVASPLLMDELSTELAVLREKHKDASNSELRKVEGDWAVEKAMPTFMAKQGQHDYKHFKWLDSSAVYNNEGRPDSPIVLSKKSLKSIAMHAMSPVKAVAMTKIDELLENMVFTNTATVMEEGKRSKHASAKKFRVVGTDGQVTTVPIVEQALSNLQIGDKTYQVGLSFITLHKGLQKTDSISPYSLWEMILEDAAVKQVGFLLDGKAVARVRAQRHSPTNNIEQSDMNIKALALVDLTVSEATSSGMLESLAVEEGAHQAATSPHNELPEPTDAQKRAGNYKKGRVTFAGFNIAIENPVDSVRSGVDPSGQSWSITMKNHYGDLSGTQGADGDPIDVFLGDDESSPHVFVVNQVDEAGGFDEHKVMLGFQSRPLADRAYLANYAEGWQGIGSIIKFTQDEFKRWLKTDTKKPARAFMRA